MTRVISQIYNDVYSVACNEICSIAMATPDYCRSLRLISAFSYQADTPVTESAACYTTSVLLSVGWHVRPAQWRSTARYIGSSRCYALRRLRYRPIGDINVQRVVNPLEGLAVFRRRLIEHLSNSQPAAHGFVERFRPWETIRGRIGNKEGSRDT